VRARIFFPSLFLILLAAHLCHTRVLWAEETLPLAAAKQMLFGKALYEEIWFDKPPLVAAVNLLWGAQTGVILRLVGAVYIFLCCVFAWCMARRQWGDETAYWAAALLGFALTFDIPSAVVPLAADLLLVWVAPAVLLAARSPLIAGICIGIGFLINTKAAFILAAALMFAWPAVVPLLAGVAIPLAITAIWLAATNTWPSFLDQVLTWPSYYAASAHVARPFMNGVLRTANWTGFHLAIVLAAGAALYRMEKGRWKWLVWLALSFAGVALGSRFFPRYFFLLLTPVVFLAARGLALLPSRARYAVLALLVIPLVRFGPRYPILALNLDPSWADLAMDTDSREASRLLRAAASSDSTLYVWGYRPEIFVYSGLPAASRYLDCQAMTGVPADRHLSNSAPVLPPDKIAAARRELAASSPAFLADGLSLYNRNLSINSYPELRQWFSAYQEIGRTHTVILYKRMLR
jgi:hypothetical protein